MTLSYSNAISIVELIAYLPSFFLAAFLTLRHGVRRSSGFIFLVIFTTARIVGAACGLAAISNPSRGLYTAAAICSSIGLSPLLMTCSGLLSRANESTTTSPLPKPLFSVFRILTIVALALTVSGITSDMSVYGMHHPNTRVKVGMILFLVSWVFLVLLLGTLYSRRVLIAACEHRALVAVAVSSPFILVRMIYAMLVWFVADDAFNAIDGNGTARLFLSVLVEMAVVFVCLGVGFTLKVRREESEGGYKPPVGGAGQGHQMA